MSSKVVGKLSVKNRQRWQRFKSHRVGYYSLYIFAFIFIVSMLSDLIANDRPLAIEFQDEWYFPIFQTYSETDFGGEFDVEADYTDPYLADIIEAEGSIIWPLIPYSYDTIIYDLPSPAPSPPSAENWLGTDDQSRDVLARVLYGTRVAILFGFSLTIASAVIGVTAGALQGYYGGRVDLFFQRFIEIWSSLPTLFMLIILASVIQPTFWILIGFMLLFSWMSYVGVVRAEFLRGRNFDYVVAARAMGMSDNRIMFKHILPNAMVATMTFVPFVLSGSVVALTSLDFLGYGLPPGSPSLGELLAQGKANLQAPWLGITAFCSLSILTGLLIFVGEAVRDAYDPRTVYK
ncbi:ABC transporter permease [Allohahella marinimesophila]|uniref:ABC transporter permease n=1 Tax=Allohahella marinimesophila TaxID=1054972 RepID=A0ABP7NKM0_9GAMM